MEALGLQPGQPVTPRALKAAYRRQARTAHPDVGGSPEKFRDLTSAYERLQQRLLLEVA